MPKSQISLLIYISLCAHWSQAETGTRPRLPISAFMREYALEIKTHETGKIELSRPGMQLKLTPGIRRLQMNGMSLYMNEPLSTLAAEPTISVADAETVLGPLMGAYIKQVIRERPLVVLDPGHGGADPGASGHFRTVEKSIALDIARRVRRKLRQTGIDVHLTRDRDHALSLPNRIVRARARGAHLFVSIHLNASRNRNAQGVETYVLPARGYPSTSNGSVSDRPYPGNKFDALNTLLACYVQKGLLTTTGATDRGVRRARFSVLRNASFPAVLVECGFLSNRTEADRLRVKDYRDSVAEGIAFGIQTYAGRAMRTIRPGESGPETAETGNKDHAGRDRPLDDIVPKTSAPRRAQDLRPSGRSD